MNGLDRRNQPVAPRCRQQQTNKALPGYGKLPRCYRRRAALVIADIRDDVFRSISEQGEETAARRITTFPSCAEMRNHDNSEQFTAVHRAAQSTFTQPFNPFSLANHRLPQNSNASPTVTDIATFMQGKHWAIEKRSSTMALHLSVRGRPLPVKIL